MATRRGLRDVWAYWLTGAAYGFAGAIQPGAFQAFVISESLRRGWRAALPSACAPLLSDAPVILLVALFLTRLPEPARRALYFISGLYILYLAWGAWRNRHVLPGDLPAGDATGKSLGRATLMNLLSPGPYIFWSLVAGPVLLQAWRQGGGLALAFLVGFYMAMCGTLALLIRVFGSAGRLNPNLARALIGLSALLLCAFGIRQLVLAAR
jgi:threonine/homoserine/homoserine lactone efflux protein